MKVGLLGGSFDPVHNGHVALARAAMEQLGLARVFFVLSPCSPFKLDRPMTPTAARLAMLGRTLRHRKNFKIGRWELKRKGPSYTVRTVEDYKRTHPRHDLYLILGSDSWNGFRKWKKPETIARWATIVVGRRPGARTISVPAAYKGRVAVLKGVFPEISSTALRNDLSHGRSVANRLPRTVERFIRSARLYGQNDFGSVGAGLRARPRL